MSMLMKRAMYAVKQIDLHELKEHVSVVRMWHSTVVNICLVITINVKPEDMITKAKKTREKHHPY